MNAPGDFGSFDNFGDFGSFGNARADSAHPLCASPRGSKMGESARIRPFRHLSMTRSPARAASTRRAERQST